MRVKYLALLMSSFFATGVMAAKSTVSLEEKLAQLEARLESAESRAANAEAQIQAIQHQQTTQAQSAPTVAVESIEPVTPPGSAETVAVRLW